MDLQKLNDPNFSKLMMKIFRTFETKEPFEFTFEDAKVFGDLGKGRLDELTKTSLPLDEFPEIIGSEATGENLPDNSPVNLPQPMLVDSVIAKPIVTYLKAPTLEALAENVNKFNKSDSIRILYSAPFQQVGNEFVKEIIYYDFEKV